MGEDGGAQVGDDPLAEGHDEVVAQRARHREDRHDDDQHAEIGVDQLPPFGGEAEIDHAAHGDGTTRVAAEAATRASKRRRDPARDSASAKGQPGAQAR